MKQTGNRQLRRRLLWGRGKAKFAFEPLSVVLSEAMPLIRRHWRTVDQPEELDPDFQSLLFFAQTGKLFVATMRTESNDLVGYCLGWCVNLMASTSTSVLMISAIYIDPLYRGDGAAETLLDMMEQAGREKGCKRLELAPQGPLRWSIGRWLKRRGWALSDEPAYWRDL